MGQPYRVNLDNSVVKRHREQTSGSKTFQYREEKRPTGIPLVAASETGEAQTQPQNRTVDSGRTILGMGVQSTALATGKVKKCLGSGTSWEARLQRVIVPYTKPKHLYGCSS